jgi:hypothetical protein
MDGDTAHLREIQAIAWTQARLKSRRGRFIREGPLHVGDEAVIVGVEAEGSERLNEGLKSFVEEPHSAIDGVGQGEIINLTDRRARASRRCQLGVLHSLGPDGIARELSALASWVERAITPTIPAQLPLPHLVMPAHHDVRTSDVLTPRLYANLAAAADRAPIDFAELLLVPGIGARTVRALATVAEVMHGAPYRFTDPARFSFAHGGKDRHPFPVPLRVYDQTINVLKSAVRNAKLGREEELAALKRLDDQARLVERHTSSPPVEALIAEERRLSHSYAGRSVFGWERPPRDCAAADSALATEASARSRSEKL